MDVAILADEFKDYLKTAFIDRDYRWSEENNQRNQSEKA